MSCHETARRTAAVAAIVLTAGAVGATAAAASSSREGVQNSGHCSQQAQWKLKVDPADGRLAVEGEVDAQVTGQHWTWRILHDGGVSAHGSATTTGGGSFTVQRELVDAPGVDRIGWRATNEQTGERCVGGVAY